MWFWHRKVLLALLALAAAAAAAKVTRPCAKGAEREERNMWELGGGKRSLLPWGKGSSTPGSGAAASEALEPSVGSCLLCNGLSLGLAGFELPRAALILGPCCALIPAGIHRSSGISPWHRHQGRLRLLGLCLAASHQGGGGF